jgi:anti-sigma B factor antagonist
MINFVLVRDNGEVIIHQLSNEESTAMQIEQEELIIRVGVVRLNGRLDAQSAPALKELWKLYDARGINSVFLNLERVDFIDSLGVSTLVAGLKQMRSRNGDLRLIGVQSPARAIFELMALDKVFQFYETEEHALKGF